VIVAPEAILPRVEFQEEMALYQKLT